MNTSKNNSLETSLQPAARGLAPVVSASVQHPFRELVWGRVLEFCREPEAVFWVYGFPVLMVLALGIAFRSEPVEELTVDVVSHECAAEYGLILSASPSLEAGVFDLETAMNRLRSGRCDLAVVISMDPDSSNDSVARDHQPVDHAAINVSEIDAPAIAFAPRSTDQFEFRFDPTSPQSVLARDRANDLLQRAAGRRDLVPTTDRLQQEPGSRYIDFLIPGLLGLSLMGGGLWGVGFVTVEMRIRKLLKRFLATPMSKSQFLLSIMVSRMLFMVPEVLLLVFFARIVFGVQVFGSPLALAFLILFGSVMFSGIGLLIASRAKTLEAVSGILNLIMMPMWIGSGVFFSRERYPDAMQPFLRALPLTPLVDALRGVMLEGQTLVGTWQELVILAAWGLVSFGLALRFFRWS